jgi:hypothetical protein
VWSGDQDTPTTAVNGNDLDRTKVIEMMVEGGTPTLNAEADLASFDSDGFTLNWATADSTLRQILAIAIGDKAAPVDVAKTTDGNQEALALVSKSETDLHEGLQPGTGSGGGITQQIFYKKVSRQR